MVWLPSLNPRLALLTSVPPILADAPAMALLSNPTLVATAPEGDYLTPAGRDTPMLLRLEGGPAAAVVLPIDKLFAERVTIALGLWRAAQQGGTPTVDAPTTAQLRRRKLILRALDAHLAEYVYREIAVGLFGRKRVPSASEWHVHNLRSRTIRLVQDGLERMRGGYLRLLRPERRSR